MILVATPRVLSLLFKDAFPNWGCAAIITSCNSIWNVGLPLGSCATWKSVAEAIDSLVEEVVLLGSQHEPARFNITQVNSTVTNLSTHLISTNALNYTCYVASLKNQLSNIQACINYRPILIRSGRCRLMQWLEVAPNILEVRLPKQRLTCIQANMAVSWFDCY